jgi:hypothetical protein
MDAGTVIITLGAAALALLPRVPAFTAEGRKQERLKRDLEVWKDMPEGEGRDLLASEIEASTKAMVEERSRDRALGQGMAFAGMAALVGFVLLALADPSDATGWKALARTVALELALAALILAVLLVTLTWALQLWYWLRSAWRKRHTEAAAEG